MFPIHLKKKEMSTLVEDKLWKERNNKKENRILIKTDNQMGRK